VEVFVVVEKDLPVSGGVAFVDIDAADAPNKLDKSCLTPTSRAARRAA
jgi:hypothetical protein